MKPLALSLDWITFIQYFNNYLDLDLVNKIHIIPLSHWTKKKAERSPCVSKNSVSARCFMYIILYALPVEDKSNSSSKYYADSKYYHYNVVNLQACNTHTHTFINLQHNRPALRYKSEHTALQFLGPTVSRDVIRQVTPRPGQVMGTLDVLGLVVGRVEYK